MSMFSWTREEVHVDIAKDIAAVIMTVADEVELDIFMPDQIDVLACYTHSFPISDFLEDDVE